MGLKSGTGSARWESPFQAPPESRWLPRFIIYYYIISIIAIGTLQCRRTAAIWKSHPPSTYFISNSRHISRQPPTTPASSASRKSFTTYMKSAGERSDRSSDPIKNAISATITTVDSGYVLGVVLAIVARSMSPPGTTSVDDADTDLPLSADDAFGAELVPVFVAL